MKTKSLVWRFYDRVIENQRTVAVTCQLCETRYKYFGNTTNLKSHLVRKHPIQWELLGTGNLDETARRRLENVNDEEATPSRKRVYHVGKNVRYSVEVNPNNISSLYSPSRKGIPEIEIKMHDTDCDYDDQESEDQTASLNLQQMHGNGSDEEWLEEDPFQTSQLLHSRPKITKKRIKREVESPPIRSYYNTMSLPITHKSMHHTTTPQRPIVITDSSPRDEFTVFGEYVANKIRKCKTPKTRGNIQQLITTILWQAEYGLYDDPASVKHVLMMHKETGKSGEEVVANVEVEHQELETTSDQIIETEVYS